ncbi:hypothetical protein [Xenorhabdus bovienii]|uniref:hypothetical protein n=1 Tax=Xenorhabdus bovienii TaxID=40576 RepID=UPI00237C58C0|nr:hypothetical protein [Xenorhabdus bovienii]MDE1475561.1 hypothetical protein [Xenorhabdus bovienii]MDE9433958.1 hypothetical protein [Xenorhabdus bovienii]MDE9463157.1 hypothetical protein [Xenorhabdus bovienii]MDE9466256.1 hypothetical protein [Xenorhabdus bovienii]MDE9470942.1 hypothetical protein [Xenorhabdus bovienii]
MKKNYWLYIVLSLLSIILLIVLFKIINVSNRKNNIEIRCAGELTSRRKVNNTDLANLNEKIFLFLYDNGTGFLTQKGVLSIDNKNHIIDREVKIGYTDFDKEQIYKFKMINVKLRANDNIPPTVDTIFPILGRVPSSFYLNIASVDKDLYIFNELSGPLFLCKRF